MIFPKNYPTSNTMFISGNIRFVGELYKKGLISTKVMDSCISQLLGSPDNWKEMKDEQVL